MFDKMIEEWHPTFPILRHFWLRMMEDYVNEKNQETKHFTILKFIHPKD